MGKTNFGTPGSQVVLDGSALTADRTITIPDAAGAVVLDVVTQTLTHKNLTDPTNTFPTFNQNTTGSAAKWTTPRLIAGNSVDGSANVSFANKFIVQGTSDSGLSAAQFLGALSTGLLKNTTSTGILSIAAAGTDYAPATSGSSILKGNGAGGFSAAAAGTDYVAPNTLAGLASIIADSASITTTEVVLATATIPTPVAGTSYRITLYGVCTSSAANLSTLTLRAGTAGTTADASIATATLTAATTGTSIPFYIVIDYQLRTTGTTGNGSGVMNASNNGTTGIAAAATTVAALTTTNTFNTTNATKLSITAKTAAATTSLIIKEAVIEIVKP